MKNYAKRNHTPPSTLPPGPATDSPVCFPLLIDSISDAIVATDNDLKIRCWNRAAERVYGWTAAEALGRGVTEVLQPQFPGMSHEEAVKKLDGGQPVVLEAAHRTKDGGLVMMLGELSPLLDEGGEMSGTVCVLRDIAGPGMLERPGHSNRTPEFLYEIVDRLLKRDLSRGFVQEVCQKLMQFLGCSMFLNYMSDRDGRMHLNACDGLDETQMQQFAVLKPGQGISGQVAQHKHILVVNNLQASADPGARLVKALGVRAYACHPLVANDEVLGTLAFGTAAKDCFDAWELALMKTVCGHVAVAVQRINTEEHLDRMATELRDKNRLITDFFTNISHEFKTPLSIILVNLQLMEYRLADMDAPRKEAFGKMVAVMRQNALRLLRLIGNLLDVTKIDAGFMKPRFVSADIVELVRGLAESVGDVASGAGLTVRFETSCAGRVVPLDCEKMERIILNLLSNAIKHTPAGGHILVSLRDTPGSVTICVSDSGEGIPLDRQDVIFDRFRQANTSLTRSSEGCGIGLSLTKSLVELLQGRIWFTSSPGRGARFYVELPVLPECSRQRLPEVEGMPLSRKLEMEFSDIHKIGAR